MAENTGIAEYLSGDMPERVKVLQSRLSDLAAGYKLFYKHELPSTNDWAFMLGSERNVAPAVFLCDMQTRGKGRFGRTWTSRDGASLTFTVLAEPKCSMESFPMLTLVYGLAACSAIRKLCGFDAMIKWPNDIVFRGRKLCGILSGAITEKKQVFIGSGFNLRKTELPSELKDKAISIEECGILPDANDLLVSVVREFENRLVIFEKTGDMSALKDEYEALLINTEKDSVVLIRENGRETKLSGRAVGIDADGSLVFKSNDGRMINVSSGEVSVSGIYGCE